MVASKILVDILFDETVSRAAELTFYKAFSLATTGLVIFDSNIDFKSLTDLVYLMLPYEVSPSARKLSHIFKS